LDLSHNKLTELSPEVFSGIPALQVLRLQNNFFRHFHSQPFQNLPHLIELDLQGNDDLESLSGKPFTKLNNLNRLNLNGCELTKLTTDSVEGLEYLRSLDLGRNQISQFPSDALRKLNHLEELELGFNYITELNPSGMSNLKNLKHFSILGCRGSPLKIQSNTFRDNSKLESVNITNCDKLTRLEAKIFSALPFLKSLNFHRSGLTSISEDAADWDSVEFFDFSHNPLECTCELEWLQKLLKSKASKSLLPPVTCKEPQELSGVELTRIKEPLCELFDSQSLDTWVIILIVIIVIVMVILIVGIIWYFFRNWLNCGCLFWKRFTGRDKTQRYPKRRLKRPSSGVVSKAEIMVITDTPDYDLTKYVDVENIYEDPAEMPLGSAKNYPDVKTTVL